MNNKGVLYAWITILASIFVVSIIYIIFDDMITNILFNKAEEFNVSPQVLETLRIAWHTFPIVFIFGLILYGLVRSQKQEPDTFEI